MNESFPDPHFFPNAFLFAWHTCNPAILEMLARLILWSAQLLSDSKLLTVQHRKIYTIKKFLKVTPAQLNFGKFANI